MTNTDGIEYTTQHDYRPTHRRVAKAVLVAKEHAEITQAVYEDYWQYVMNSGEPTNWDVMESLANRANMAADDLLEARDVALNECSCTPDLPDGRTGRVCAVCLNRDNNELPFEGE